MTKKSLGSGLDGWIKDTKRTHDRLQESPSSTESPDAPAAPASTGTEASAEVGTRAETSNETRADSQPSSDPSSSRPSMSIEVIPIADLEAPPPRLPPVENEDLEWLKASIFRDGQLQPVVVRMKDGRPWLVTGYRRLRALQDLSAQNIIAIVHREMSDNDARKVYISDNLPRLQADPAVLRDLVASVGVAELERWGIPPRLIQRAQAFDAPAVEGAATDHAAAPKSETGPRSPSPSPNAPQAGLRPEILQVDDSSFEREVIGADQPVLVALHLPGQLDSEAVQAAMVETAEAWGLKDQALTLCAMDIMACDGPAVPQLIKVGRGFLEKELPRVLLYHTGFQRHELKGARNEPAIDANGLLQMLDDALR